MVPSAMRRRIVLTDLGGLLEAEVDRQQLLSHRPAPLVASGPRS
jgi:hypothetical protein